MLSGRVEAGAAIAGVAIGGGGALAECVVKQPPADNISAKSGKKRGKTKKSKWKRRREYISPILGLFGRCIWAFRTTRRTTARAVSNGRSPNNT
jgi:hypothetical protein